VEPSKLYPEGYEPKPGKPKRLLIKGRDFWNILFLSYLQDGKIKFTKDGFIVVPHEGGIFLPSRVFNKCLLF
jgi:hypothetical protein